MYRLIANGRDVPMQGHCVSGTIHFWDQRSLKICSGIHRFRTSHHHALYMGGVTWRPETMCHHTIVLAPLVPQLIVRRDRMSLDWYIPVIMQYTIPSLVFWCKRTGFINAWTLCFRDDSSRGSGVPKHSYGDTTFWVVLSLHLEMSCSSMKSILF